MATNQIREVTFRPVAGTSDDAAPGHALFIALELAQPEQLPGFLEEVVARFKREHATGPRDARFMLITALGEVSAADFASAWQAAIAHDAPARAMMGMLQQADVMQGDLEGRMVGQASLLAGATEPS